MAKTDGKKLVIVESPTKAKTIRKFLGKDFIVESCMGHIRDLPKSAKEVPEKFKKQKWARLGVDVENDFEPLYCIPNDKKKVVSGLKDKLEGATELYLATDEDREGESISWHLMEVLKPKVPVKRMVFHEITKEAILESLAKTRKIDDDLVRAQEARRILDRLVGFSLSPLLWKKVSYGLSAGRVQSVALRLISERELQRFKFKKAIYCGVDADLEHDSQQFQSRLLTYKNLRVATGKDFDQETGLIPADKQKQTLLLDKKQADEVVKSLKGKKLKVDTVDERPITREPSAPFITSTLQQDASRKFGWASKHTMRTAQQLYEQGYITYMRTDSINLSEQAIKAARKSVKDLYGDKFLSKTVRTFQGKKVKGAQEAHEAIRPAGASFPAPDETDLKADMLKLYDLIWKRTMATQMASSQQRQISVRMSVGECIFASSGTIIEFAGFLKVYEESTDDVNDDEGLLPELKAGQSVDIKVSKVTEHETKPPSRLTEAGLIQVMEKEGIGRPSTYASIISTITERGYAQRVGNTLVPTFTALVVAKLLGKYFPEYVDLKFTSKMEECLDEIADGDLDSISYLKSIYLGKEGLQAQIEKKEKLIDVEDAKKIEIPSLSKLTFKVGKFGAYVCKKVAGEEQCVTLPDSKPPSEVTEAFVDELLEQKINGADALGKDPKTGMSIYILTGRYGPYVQLGENENDDDKEAKPKRTSIPPTMKPDLITLDQALILVSLPKTLGQLPETGKDIKLGIGRFGPYVVSDGDYRSIPKTEDFFEVDLKKALELFAQPKKGRGARSTILKELGKLPNSETPIQILNGKYGPYIKVGKVNVSLPEGSDPQKFTLAEALDLIGTKADLPQKKAKKAKKVSKAAPKVKVVKKAKDEAVEVQKVVKAPAKAAKVVQLRKK